MNILKKLKETKFLTGKEIRWLVGDIVSEFECDSPKECKDRRLIAWFLTNTNYLPYKKISQALDYYRAPQSYIADMSYVNSVDVTFSLSGFEKEKIEVMRQIADKYYDCGKNIYLDRVADGYLEEALLFGASKACDCEDRKSNYNTGFSMSKSPSSSQLINLMNLLNMEEKNSDPVAILDLFEIIKNE